MKVTYIGPVFDSSGYGNASRNNVAALHHAGVEVDVMPISFEKTKTNHGNTGKLVKSLVNPNPNNPIHIIHCTPQNYPKLVTKNRYNIGYAAWETSKLPSGWANYINMLDEIWCPSEYNVEIFKNSGVNIPVKKVPHTFDTSIEVKPDISVLTKRNKDEFVFYSIFQWLERKNPIGLLLAYLTEFSHNENVTLVLKTFLQNHNNPKETEKIRESIRSIKKKLHIEKFPRILLIPGLLSSTEMAGLHTVSDCFVLPHRSEGFGIPIAEAMLYGNPTISTGYSGNVDFVKHGETGYLTKYQITPVFGMPWPIYTGNMNWAEPNIEDLKLLMRTVYEDKTKALEIGIEGKKYIENTFSWLSVGSLMKQKLREVLRGSK